MINIEVGYNCYRTALKREPAIVSSCACALEICGLTIII